MRAPTTTRALLREKWSRAGRSLAEEYLSDMNLTKTDLMDLIEMAWLAALSAGRANLTDLEREWDEFRQQVMTKLGHLLTFGRMP